MVVEGQHSCTCAVTAGIPQGSVLEHTLFHIYTNDIGDSIKSTIRLFADDTMLYNTIKTATYSAQLKDYLNITLESCEGRWQMLFSGVKCHHPTVTKKRNRITTSYTLHDQILEKVTSAKYLRVEMTENLHCGKHIQAIATNANKVSAFVCRNLK